jgi:hypothetical protein
MTPEEFALHVRDVLLSKSLRGDATSDVYMNGESAEFYADIFSPGEGNQRFTVTVTESTDIR